MPKLAGYSGTPLVRKLGIKAVHKVAVVGAPEDFAETLGELPFGAESYLNCMESFGSIYTVRSLE